MKKSKIDQGNNKGTCKDIWYPNLPNKEFVRDHTVLIGGEVLMVGLTLEQANEIQRFASDHGVVGEGHNRMKVADSPLDDFEKKMFRERGLDIPENSLTLYLGHTTNCYKPLFKALDIVIPRSPEEEKIYREDTIKARIEDTKALTEMLLNQMEYLREKVDFQSMSSKEFAIFENSFSDAARELFQTIHCFFNKKNSQNVSSDLYQEWLIQKKEQSITRKDKLLKLF